MVKTIQDILDNRNDLIEDTFCYRLFELGEFDEQMLTGLIRKIEYATTNKLLTAEVCETLGWIIACVDQVFSSHHDKDDLYTITNYTPAIEHNWNSLWRKQIAFAKS